MGEIYHFRIKMEINDLRKKIEEVTVEIFQLVGERFVLAQEMAEAKMKDRLPVEDIDAERKLKEVVSKKCKSYGVDLDFGLRLLNLLIEESKNVQKNIIKKAEEKAVFSTPYEVFAEAKKIERMGKTLIHLEVGEPDFGPPENVKEAVTDALKHGYAHYTETVGIPPLREKIASATNELFRADILPEQVIVTPGGRYAVYLCIASILSPGDEAILFEPAWPAYKDCIRAVQAKAVTIPSRLENNWEHDLDALVEHITRLTKMIILNNPTNPTGKIIGDDALRQIVEIARENNIFILSDEVYSNFTFKPFKSILEFPDCKYIFANSFSKTFGMTGFRIGYAISDNETIKRMTKIQNLCLTSVPEFIQYAAMKALDCVEEARKYAKTVEERIGFLCRALDEIPVSYYKPDGGFYVFPKLRDEKMDTQIFVKKLLTEKEVCVTPGTAFGEEYKNFFRITACQPQNLLLEAVERMGDLLK
ncbi:MAG: aminotransferase class I/II-fold pyridoxal phosphate-dependent enzyme [Candidatus Bathycorpusculaceae bacterium]